MSVNERLEKVRQEIIQLLQAQLEALADLSNLSDAQLAACYTRHERVRELRDRLVLLGDNWNSLEVAAEPAAAPPIVIGEAAVAELSASIRISRKNLTEPPLRHNPPPYRGRPRHLPM